MTDGTVTETHRETDNTGTIIQAQKIRHIRSTCVSERTAAAEAVIGADI
ncbi:MAG: hypothetical protein V8R14_02380 [Clostridia bacterium]